jgi:GGDEF domain-containing protein
VNGRVSHRRNARSLKAFSLLYLGLVVASMLLVHGASYEPAVSFILLYLLVSAGVTAAVAMLLLPTVQFGGGFSGGAYVLYAAVIAMMVFFSGGVSSELYVLFFPLLLASALHGSWRITLVALFSVLFCYALAVMPGLLNGGTDSEAAALVFYRLATLGLAGVFSISVARNFFNVESPEDYYATDEDGSMLLGRVEDELAARRGVQVAVILVDPGRWVEDVELLLERVRARIADPILLGEGTVFGVVLSGVDDRMVESAARRALAAASSLGAEETRAGAAVYPRDARTAEDLLVAAGQALEAAFEVESPSAIVMAGRSTPRAEGRYRAAR